MNTYFAGKELEDFQGQGGIQSVEWDRKKILGFTFGPLFRILGFAVVQ